MKIVDAKTYILDIPVDTIKDSQYTVNKINLIVLKLSTDDGIDGYGYNWNTASGMDLPYKMFNKYIKNVIIGEDPFMRLKIMDKITNVNNFGWDPRLGINGLGVYILSMVDMALWDILCKKMDMPLYKVLGAKSDIVEAYNTHGGWLSWPLDKLVENAMELKNEGYNSIKIKVGSKNTDDDYERIKAVRNAVGNKMKIMIDANTKWDLETAIMMSNKLYEFNIYWLEEPLNSLDVRSHKILREKSRIPIALGESLNNEYIFRDYIINNAVDIIQVDATKVSGITEWLKIANLAEAFGINVYPHTNIQQPLHAQLVLSVKNGRMVEHVPWLLDVWKYPLKPENGYFHLNNIKGAGTEIKETAIEKYSVKKLL
ncbi:MULTISPECIES: mandelate racemase/muconate lactonizing enzyme family protein [Acidiplasma]|jgi:L-alanine-DL-glutamate epimerase-like enolase superfamily enzyme|uniref:Mandelate racemase/muconate lactonizing enzyme C-terminal domain-containing protein n=3 Tax=Acidiplasma TaxID=507753 RepID=A0A0Q0VTN2_9ARCH|nr:MULTISPECIES: mandelate racemase/muconate lactonizing enzyme family protein [Acidiplasma]KJE49493.1 hypothetical protein TZ01_05630 [Acidiplasma sp. MBA-1]KQB34361.1 hypothetical protein AOG54_05065 [Acidiplasma aeolicum]KQB34931.1 hypothetical protein AOG55_08545 [Acidiplasma cupricumulans]WMT54522.1 MAG: mandelate racemase/muconate lactonizing enzyme family protein [Acidiplasma sp.]